MVEKIKPGEGVVITIGAGGKPVDPDLAIIETARQIAIESGGTVVVTQLLQPGEEVDGRPVQVNSLPPASDN